jgi:hypothetical protein
MSYWIDADIREFHRRADEARTMAQCAVTAHIRERFLRIAKGWEALIKGAETQRISWRVAPMAGNAPTTAQAAVVQDTQVTGCSD